MGRIRWCGACLVLATILGACATTPDPGPSASATEIPRASIPRTGRTKPLPSASSSPSTLYRLPESPLEFWRSVMTSEVAFTYRAINGVSQCTLFVSDTLKTYFDPEVHSLVFPSGVLGSNDTYLAWLENEHLLRLSPDEFSIRDIQALADQGYLILMAYYYPAIAGHVAFVGHGSLDLFTVPPIKNLEGSNGKRLPANYLPVMVQAGTYTGITSMVYATNGWLRNDNYGSGVVCYYAVRIPD